MGGYYAAAAGEAADVVDALTEHYRPQGPSDSIPYSLYGQIVALADKIDTLTGFFGIGAKPTGSRDPFALRRAALGILRIIDEGNLVLSLDAPRCWRMPLLFTNQLDKEQRPIIKMQK